MRLWKKKEKNPDGVSEPRQPPRQVWDRDPAAARRDVITGLPLDVLTGADVPDSLQPKVDPDKTRVFDDELDQD
jgi:hypothetical protein